LSSMRPPCSGRMRPSVAQLRPAGSPACVCRSRVLPFRG